MMQYFAFVFLESASIVHYAGFIWRMKYEDVMLRLSLLQDLELIRLQEHYGGSSEGRLSL